MELLIKFYRDKPTYVAVDTHAVANTYNNKIITIISTHCIKHYVVECLRIGDKEKQISDTATTHDVTTGTSNVEPTSTTGGNEKSAPTNNGG